MEKIKTLVWFIKRPMFWEYALHLILELLKGTRKLEEEENKKSIENSNKKSKSLVNALINLGVIVNENQINYIDDNLISSAKLKIKKSGAIMGGAADITLLYNLVKLTEASNVVETGVAYGWSSLAILEAQKELKTKILVSVDMPYPKQSNEHYVGIVVPDELKRNWTLIKQPDRRGLIKALSIVNNKIDLCHYDSDKTIPGRRFGYELLWGALKKGGIFISDDIDDNLEFYRFMDIKKARFEVIKCDAKYVGVAIKN
jgi:predicted O-methyltransferase YrrM